MKSPKSIAFMASAALSFAASAAPKVFCRMATLIVVVLVSCVHGAHGEPLTNLMWTLSQNVKIEGNLLIVDVPADKAKEGGCARTRVDMTAYSGECYSFRIAASCAGMSAPPHHYSGLKFQTHYVERETGKERWFDTPMRFRQKDFAMQTITTTDPNLERSLEWVDVKLGLEEVSGKAVFDLSTLVLDNQKDIFPPVNQSHRAVYSESVRSRPRMRGVMLPIGLVSYFNSPRELNIRMSLTWELSIAITLITRLSFCSISLCNFSSIGTNADALASRQSCSIG